MDFFDPKNIHYIFTRQPNPERGLFMVSSQFRAYPKE